MVFEGNEIASGWPLGLGSMNSRIRVASTSQAVAVAVAAAAPQPPRPYASRLLHISSFSSFSSSNLDTESTASFFPDQSVSLGRLIGLRPRNKGGIAYNEHRKITDQRAHPGVPETHENSQGLCAPLLHHVIGKRGRNGNNSRN